MKNKLILFVICLFLVGVLSISINADNIKIDKIKIDKIIDDGVTIFIKYKLVEAIDEEKLELKKINLSSEINNLEQEQEYFLTIEKDFLNDCLIEEAMLKEISISYHDCAMEVESKKYYLTESIINLESDLLLLEDYK